MAFNGILTILCLISCRALAQRYYPGYYGYYGGYSFYGNQASCGGNGFNTLRCPDRTVAPGNCAATLSCAQFAGYTCISPGICCRTATTANVCPNGLTTGFTCPGGVCALGQVCVNGMCCVGTTVTNNVCANSAAGAGQCIQTTAGFQCGVGFTCVIANNICCPTVAATNNGNGGVPSSLASTTCANGRQSTLAKCTDSNQCTGFGANSYCYNTFCCGLPAGQIRAAPNSNVTNSVCDDGKEPTGPCDKVKLDKACRGKDKCNTKYWFCCPAKE